MKKHPWYKAWVDKKFEIKTLTPSVLVFKYQKLLSAGDWVLDIGSGNGRNAIYLANQGINVDAFDVVDLIKWDDYPDSLKKRIHFKTSTVLEYPYPKNKYKAIVIARVIQYLNPKEIDFLLEKVKECIRPDGFLLLSYTTEGGVFSRKEIDVPKHVYNIEDIKLLLRKYFKEIDIQKGSSRNMHVNYSDEITTFDIYATN